MKTKISLKKTWISSSGWRGYEEPINAICGANNTGSYSDSPCPEKTCLAELEKAKKILRKNKIPFKQTWCQTTNVFCIHGYIVVPAELKETAKNLIAHLPAETRLLYLT
jgi:hypothetical protein